MRVGHVYHRRKEYVEQEEHEHAPLTKAVFHSGPPQARTIAEPHACSHAITELTNIRDNILLHTKPAEYCPEESSVNGVVRLTKIDKSIYLYKT